MNYSQEIAKKMQDELRQRDRFKEMNSDNFGTTEEKIKFITNCAYTSGGSFGSSTGGYARLWEKFYTPEMDREEFQDLKELHGDFFALVDLCIEYFKNRNWIPCSERLPTTTDDTEYWITIEQEEGYRYCDTSVWRDRWKGFVLHKVIAWMPLPEPWRGKV